MKKSYLTVQDYEDEFAMLPAEEGGLVVSETPPPPPSPTLNRALQSAALTYM